MPDLSYRSVPMNRFELPALPFERHSLEPEISRAQVDLLYSYHHRSHVDALNARIAADDPRSLVQLAESAEETIRYHAREAWNLVFFWHGLTARSVEMPAPMGQRIDAAFGSLANLRAQWRGLVETTHDGWVWLTCDSHSEVRLVTSKPGSAPPGARPLLAIALSDDACRIDHDSQHRGAYFDALWAHLNWEYAWLNLGTADEPVPETPAHRP